MNEPEKSFQDSSDGDLKLQVAELTRQSNILFIGLIIVSLTLLGFVKLQARRAGQDLAQARPQANQFLEMNKKETPAFQNFLGQLAAYGQGHPDYAEKVLAKFNIKPGAATAPVTGATQPTTAPKK